MEDVEQVSSLIRDIYDAAITPTLWTGALRKVREFVGGSAAVLLAKDSTGETLDVHYEDGGLDAQGGQRYLDRYVGSDPFASGHALADVAETVTIVDLPPCGAGPQLRVDFIGAALDKSATGAAMFGVFRHEHDGLVDDTARRRMRLIVPHLRRAVRIGRARATKIAKAATFADVLDGLSAGLFLVDATGCIVHANANGQAMLQERSALRAASGRLVALEPGAAAALNEFFIAAAAGDAALGTAGICVALRARDGSCYVAHALPLPSGARQRPGAGCAAVAALFVHKAELESPASPEAIAKLHQLTPAELRVLLAIARVGGVQETAEALGIAETTVKTHLHRLFGKTGTSRQADLVKLVAGCSRSLLAAA